MYQKYYTFTKPGGDKVKVKFRGKTEEEAIRRRDQAILEYEQGLFFFNNKTSLADYAQEYIQRKKLSADGKRRLQRHVIANIGQFAIKDIRVAHIEKCLQEVVGSSSSNINKTWSVMYRLFQTIVNDDILMKNPMDKVERPRGTRGRRRPLNTTEQKLFRQVLHESMACADAGSSRRADLLFGLTYACGLRPGEVRALSWKNVFLHEKPFPFIRVCSAVKTKSRSIGEPKTEAGKRDVPIPDWFAVYLRQYFKEWKASGSQNPLLFPAVDGEPLSEAAYQNRWLLLLKRMAEVAEKTRSGNKMSAKAAIGSELTPYYLRHTYRTNLMEAKVEPMVAGHWMGHDSHIFSDIGYAHITNQIIEDAVKALNKYELSCAYTPEKRKNS